MMACQHDNITHIVSPEQDAVPEGMVEIEFVAWLTHIIMVEVAFVQIEY